MIKVRCHTCGKIGIDFNDREKAVGFALHHNETSGHAVKVFVVTQIMSFAEGEPKPVKSAEEIDADVEARLRAKVYP